MNANNILIVGIGQAGNNIAEEMAKQNPKISSICINSSETDMETLEHVKNKVTLPAKGGANRDRNNAKQFLKDEIYLVADTIKSYASKEHIYIAFSLGGGTGSGITPMLLQVLANTMPNRLFNLIGVLPSEKEGRKAQANTVECWQELMTLEKVNIGAIYLLDNNKRNSKQTINREFARLFNKYLDMTKPHIDGVIDSSELTELGTTTGLTGIYNIDDYLDNPDEIETECLKNSIFVLNARPIQLVGMTAPKGFNKEAVVDRLKHTGEFYEGFVDGEEAMMVLAGVKMTNKAVEHAYDTYKYKTELMELNQRAMEEEPDIEFDMPINKPKSVKHKTEAKSLEELVNSGDFWDSIMKM